MTSEPRRRPVGGYSSEGWEDYFFCFFFCHTSRSFSIKAYTSSFSFSIRLSLSLSHTPFTRCPQLSFPHRGNIFLCCRARRRISSAAAAAEAAAFLSHGRTEREGARAKAGVAGTAPQSPLDHPRYQPTIFLRKRAFPPPRAPTTTTTLCTI